MSELWEVPVMHERRERASDGHGKLKAGRASVWREVQASSGKFRRVVILVSMRRRRKYERAAGRMSEF